MNCQEFWNALPRQGQETTPTQASHLAECPACAAQWAPHRALAGGLRSLAEELRHCEAPPRVEAGLTAAFRAQADFRRRTAVRIPWFTPVFAWASAAAAMILLAAFLVKGWQPAPTRPGMVAAPHQTAQPSMEWAALQPSTAAYADQDDDSSGLGDGFIRLPNAARIEPNEDVNFVRVEVPGSAMIAMGIPVSEDRAAETLLADVALGPDGMARAVRLVNDGGTF
jgi:hypothetical protein